MPPQHLGYRRRKPTVVAVSFGVTIPHWEAITFRWNGVLPNRY